MKKQNLTEEDAVKGQDFADPKAEKAQKPSSHGEVANQKDGDFSELEESRMEHPPKHRDGNGSDKNDTDNPKGSVSQQEGVN